MFVETRHFSQLWYNSRSEISSFSYWCITLFSKLQKSAIINELILMLGIGCIVICMEKC